MQGGKIELRGDIFIRQAADQRDQCVALQRQLLLHRRQHLLRLRQYSLLLEHVRVRDLTDLVFAPQERLFLYGRWQEGIEPAIGLTQKDRGQFQRLQDLFVNYRSSGAFTRATTRRLAKAISSAQLPLRLVPVSVR